MSTTVVPIQLSVHSVAQYTGWSVSTVRRLIADGKLPTVRLGRRVVRVLRTDIDVFLAAHRAVDWPPEGPVPLRLTDGAGAVVAEVKAERAPAAGETVEAGGASYRVVRDDGIVQDVRWPRVLVVEPA